MDKMRALLEKLRAQNETLIADLQAIGSHDDKEIVELQQLIEQRTQQIEQLQLAQNTLRVDARITELELKEAHQKMAEMEEELTQYQRKAAQRLEELQKLQQEELTCNWGALTKYEEVKTQLIELQRSVEFYQEREKELKQTLVENELTARLLKKEVDESTLQASKAIQLEKRLEEMNVQLALLQDEQKLQQQQQQEYPHCSRINRIDASQSGYTSEDVPLQLANNKANANVYKVDDLILVENEPFGTGTSRKLEPRNKGPFITKVLPNDRYLVEDLPHVKRKQKHCKSDYSSGKMKHWCQLPPDELDDEEDNGKITAIDSCEDAAICQERPTVKLG
ncbi:hypothetical protein KR215_002201 [Drosophila sulfurigaster]|nr:hypothetical protein KR215_002201 [Drosophila sulfurigaster]